MIKISDFVLKKGDIIELIAISSPITETEFSESIEFVKSLGLVPKISDITNFNGSGSFLYANEDIARFAILKNAIEATDSKAIWFLKGGHGAPKLLSYLGQIKQPKTSKLLIGFSDVTILLNYFGYFWQWPSIHGPMLNQIVNKTVSDVAKNNVCDLIFGQKPEISYKIEAFNNSAKANKAKIAGLMLGGCLALLQTFIGTKQRPNFAGSIMLLEDDRFETAQRADRIFDHMLRSGFLSGQVAVILGNFLEDSDLREEEKNKIAEAFANLSHNLDGLNLPLYRYQGFGHGINTESLPLGVIAKIEVAADDKPILKFDL